MDYFTWFGTSSPNDRLIVVTTCALDMASVLETFVIVILDSMEVTAGSDVTSCYQYTLTMKFLVHVDTHTSQNL